jgi:hypothetical protein
VSLADISISDHSGKELMLEMPPAEDLRHRGTRRRRRDVDNDSNTGDKPSNPFLNSAARTMDGPMSTANGPVTP